MALANRQVLIEYDVGGGRLLHERYVLEHYQNDTYAIVTPDRDVYLEDLTVLNSDIRSMMIRPGPGILPGGVTAAEVYALPVFTINDMAGFRDEARRLIDLQRGAAPAAPPAAGAAAAAAAPAVTAFDPEAGFPSGELKWLAAECLGGYCYGQEVAAVTQPLVKGSKHVQDLPGGLRIFAECVAGEDYFAFRQRPSLNDHRILPIQLNPMGTPERSLQDVAQLCKESKVKWSLTGPRIARWCVAYLAVENLGFEGHHERLRTVTKADASSWGIQEHFQVSMAVRQALLVDQLDAFNLLSIEVQFRRLQTIEFSYSEKARELEAKSVGGRLSLEEQTTFGGVTRQFSTLMICPELLTHVKEETEREASLAKNLRKAREEREAARRKGGKQSENP